MSKQKKLYVLIVVLLIAIILALIAGTVQTRAEKIEENGTTVLSIEPASVTAVSWDTESSSFAFHKSDDTWVYDADEAFPVNADAIEELLAVFEDFGASFTIDDVDNLGTYGLDSPECTIKISTADEDYTITLGNYSEMDSQRYFSLGDDQVHLAKNDPTDTFNVELSDLIQNDVVPDVSEATKLSFSGESDLSIEYAEDNSAAYSDDDVYFADGKALDSSKVETYLSRVKNLNLTSYVTYNASQEELEAYGLDKPELTISATYEENGQSATLEVNVGRNQAELEKAEASSDDDAESSVTAYARIGDSPIVYTITSTEYTNLMAATYEDLRHEEVLPYDMSELTQVDITLDGQSYSITSTGSGSKQTWTYGDDDDVSISALKSALSALDADTLTQDKPTGKEEISVTLHFDNENHEKVEITLYRSDGTQCVAVVDGEPYAYVTRSRVVDLIETVNEIVL